MFNGVPMLKFKKILGTATVGVVLAVAFSTSVAAATLSLVGTSTATTLPSTFSLSGALNGISPSAGDIINVYQSPTNGGSIGGGLSLSTQSGLRFTFLGKEAGAANAVFSLAGSTLSNTGAVGSSFTTNYAAGAVSFFFETIFTLFNPGSQTITNGGISTLSALGLGFGSIFNNGQSVLAFFGDGRGDFDYDDMLIRIDVVPLPASLLMLLGSLGGFGAFRRLRKTA